MFKWKDENGTKQQLRIIEAISHRWQQLAILVGLSMNKINAIENNFHPEQRSLRVFDIWITSSSDTTTAYPVTWNGLHRLLEDINYRALAERMKVALRTVGIDISDNSEIGKHTKSAILFLPSNP